MNEISNAHGRSRGNRLVSSDAGEDGVSPCAVVGTAQVGIGLGMRVEDILQQQRVAAAVPANRLPEIYLIGRLEVRIDADGRAV